MTPGKLGGAVSEEEGYAAARQRALNALAAIKKQVGALSAIRSGELGPVRPSTRGQLFFNSWASITMMSLGRGHR